MMEGSLQNMSDSVKPIVERGIENAKSHGINVHHGVANLASGDCALESMIDGISTRKCFEESYDGTPEFWRNKWFTEVESLAFAFYDAGMSRPEWKAEWNHLKISGQYEYVLGDLMLPAIAHCTKKDVLIFNTSPRAHAPIFVVEASTLGQRPPNTEIPVLLAYDQSHYESLVPDTEEDIRRTVELKNRFLEGTYTKSVGEIPVLRQQIIIEKQSYAGVLQQTTSSKKRILTSPERPDLAANFKRPNYQKKEGSFTLQAVGKKQQEEVPKQFKPKVLQKQNSSPSSASQNIKKTLKPRTDLHAFPSLNVKSILNQHRR